MTTMNFPRTPRINGSVLPITVEVHVHSPRDDRTPSLVYRIATGCKFGIVSAERPEWSYARKECSNAELLHELRNGAVGVEQACPATGIAANGTREKSVVFSGEKSPIEILARMIAGNFWQTSYVDHNGLHLANGPTTKVWERMDLFEIPSSKKAVSMIEQSGLDIIENFNRLTEGSRLALPCDYVTIIHNFEPDGNDWALVLTGRKV